MKYDVDFFIQKFSAIPEERWYVGDFTNEYGTKCCALGHCGSRHFSPSREGVSLSILMIDRLKRAVWDINDNKDNKYQQPTPKQRILAALNDIKKLQEKDLVASGNKSIDKSCDAPVDSSNSDHQPKTDFKAITFKKATDILIHSEN